MDSETDQSPELMETASAGIGDRLRAAREAKRLNMAHIAAETRIPERHLHAIEAGDFAALPSRTYAIGFSRTFAKAVGLDEAEVADAVREELADGSAQQSALAGGMEPGDPAKLPSRGLAWFGGLAALLLTVGAIAFFNSYFGAGQGLGSLIASDAEDVAQDDVAAGEGADGEGDAGDDAATTTGPNPEGAVVLTVTEGEVWMRVSDDTSGRLFEGVLASGESYTVPATAQNPRINTARPDIIAITIGGQSVPKLAEEQQVMGDAPISAAALLARGNQPAPANSGE